MLIYWEFLHQAQKYAQRIFGIRSMSDEPRQLLIGEQTDKYSCGYRIVIALDNYLRIMNEDCQYRRPQINHIKTLMKDVISFRLNKVDKDTFIENVTNTLEQIHNNIVISLSHTQKS